MRERRSYLELRAELTGELNQPQQPIREVINYISMPTVEDVRAGRYGFPKPPVIFEAPTD